jgi:hypothetical protein
MTVYFTLIIARGVKMQMWTRIGSHHLSALLRNRRYPRRPDMTINIPGLKTPVNIDNNYGLRLTAYYRVSVILDTVKQDTVKEKIHSMEK